ncbi:MAG: DsbA family protein [Rhodobacteraceae bacterium]|nr:DsbA family protein [Paracoccaceae bacterium]
MNRIRTIALATLAVAAGGFFVTTPDRTGVPHSLTGAAFAQDAGVDVSMIHEMTLGVEDAPVTIIEYASYTCPHCRVFHEGPYKQLKADYIDTGKVRFIYREVYYDRFGLWASMVARCSGPEKFFGITELLYAGQDSWSRAGDPVAIVDELRKIGLLAGIEPEALDACLQDATRARTLVTWYQQNAGADGVTSTPSFVVNGRKVTNLSYGDLQALIEQELNRN